jgi:hypothetical protein
LPSFFPRGATAVQQILDGSFRGTPPSRSGGTV